MSSRSMFHRLHSNSPVLAVLVRGLLFAVSPVDAAEETSAETNERIALAETSPEDGGSPIENVTVVRSRNRLEPLQEVPLSISLVTGEELDRLQATDISALTLRAANVSWNQGNQRTSSLSIRGVGKQGQTEAQDPSVGIIVDGVNYAYNALTSSYDFTDVDTVEVTRGPQGTLLGKNTSLGVVNVTTRRPSFTPDATYSLTFGQDDTFVGQLAGGGAVIDDVLAWRGAFSVSKGEGDIRNIYNEDVTYTNKDRVSGRVQLLFTPTEHFSARLAIDAQPRGGETTNGRTIRTPTPAVYADGSINNLSTDAAVRLARPYFTQRGSFDYERDYLYGGGQNVVNNDAARPLVTGSNGATLQLDWQLQNFELTSISAYKDYHFNATNDEGTPFDIHRNSGGFWNDYRQISQELRLSSDTGGLVDYQTGVFLLKVDNSADYRREWGNDAGAWFASPTQYRRLDVAVNPDGSISGGRTLMQNSLSGLKMSYNSPAGVQDIENKSAAAFAQANWHLPGRFTLTTGVRFTHEDRRNTGLSIVRENGYAPELNPVAVNGVELGGFASSNTGALLDGANSATQLSLADQVANKYFGVPITATPGQAYRSLTPDQLRQVADAKAIRAAQMGVVFARTEAEPFKSDQPAFVISQSYAISADQSTYLSWQYGEKAGISQLTNGVSNLVKAEKTSAFEWGVKSSLLNGALVLNTAIFHMDIKDYQQGVRVLDVYTTNLNNDGTLYYTSATGNVPRVEVKGVEIDGVYAGIPNTTLRFSGAYNDARYKEFPNSAQPSENGYSSAPPYRDVSGEALPGAAKWSFNLGIDYRMPTVANLEFHTSANAAYTGRNNSDNALSSYSWLPARTLVDLAIGVGTQDERYDVSLLAKNLLDDDTPLATTWNSYTPAVPRWFGVMFTGKIL
ncbi:MAG TPA: TonB-dependent receptor [Steroidobacter sp.]|uniref:TonB-dependent receptor n=1 Tax=Steroidobacter sp. TaxID=1978227 RepID=UPI002EDB7ABA